jgi:hypothetical protein
MVLGRNSLPRDGQLTHDHHLPLAAGYCFYMPGPLPPKFAITIMTSMSGTEFPLIFPSAFFAQQL